MRIIPLGEGSFTIDKTKQFIPFNKAADNLKDRSPGSILVEIQPFAVVTSRDVLLMDTGLGFYTPEGKMQLHHNLETNGIDPNSVTKVLLSHLHKDHAGGIQDERAGSLSLPNAKYYVTKKELEFASAEKSPSYQPEMFTLLQNSSQTVTLEDSGSIDDYIHYEICGGHSKCHSFFKIQDESETVFFGGDVAPQLQQMKNKFIAKYDFDGRRSMQLRQEWWTAGTHEAWTFLFYHDIKTPFVKAV